MMTGYYCNQIMNVTDEMTQLAIHRICTSTKKTKPAKTPPIPP